MSERPIDNMANIVLAIKLTNYEYEMEKRGYSQDEMKKQVELLWEIVIRK